MTSAKRDNYGVPSILGVHRGETIPIQATSDGKLCVSTDGSIGGGGGTTVIRYDYKLVKTIRLDLSVPRSREVIKVDFDCLVIADIRGDLIITVDRYDMTINKCISLDITAKELQISHILQVGHCEIWLFRKEKVSN